MTLEDFNHDHATGLPRDLIAHLATSTDIPTAGNVIILRPPGVGKTHLVIGLGIRAVHHGHFVLFDTATGWLDRLSGAHIVTPSSSKRRAAAPIPWLLTS